jgi:ketosteroid isomerase-like protein
MGGRLRKDSEMASTEDFADAIEQYHQAASEFVKANPEPYKMMFSHRDDVTVANPFGPPARGWEQVSETIERACELYREGRIAGFENVSKHVTPELGYIVEVERFSAKIGGAEEEASIALRTTSILRPEEEGWRVMHRHADPITSARPPESIIQ